MTEPITPRQSVKLAANGQIALFPCVQPFVGCNTSFKPQYRNHQIGCNITARLNHLLLSQLVRMQ